MILWFMVFYRDGVGDGQILDVMEHELAAITNCFRQGGCWTKSRRARRRFIGTNLV